MTPRNVRRMNLSIVAGLTAFMLTLIFGWAGLVCALVFAWLLGYADALEGDDE